MTPLQNLSVEQLRKLVAIKEQIETLQGEIEAIAGGGEVGISAPEIPKRRGRKKMSRSAAARIAVAARWAKARAAMGEAAPKRGGKFSAAHRAALAAAQRARWAKVRAMKGEAAPEKGRARLRWAKVRRPGTNSTGPKRQ